jgi:hypothetical protein
MWKTKTGRFLPVTGRDTGWENTGAGRDTVEGFSVRIGGIPFSTRIIPFSSRLHSPEIWPISTVHSPIGPTLLHHGHIKASPNPKLHSALSPARLRSAAASRLARHLLCCYPPSTYRLEGRWHCSSNVSWPTTRDAHQDRCCEVELDKAFSPGLLLDVLTASTPRCWSLSWLLPAAPPNPKPPRHQSHRLRFILGTHLSMKYMSN